MKLNVLLAKTDHLAEIYRNSVKDYVQFFKSKQAAFKGERRTWVAREGMIDQPTKRVNKLVTTTVKEKFDWLIETNKEFIDAVFSQEATNAAGLAKATLSVEGEALGTYSSLELLRLKSLLENGDLVEMYNNLPTREDDQEWGPCTAEQYKDRDIFEGPKLSGVDKSLMKEGFILPDPNIAAIKDASRYTPQIGTKDTVIEVGDYTYQRYSGEISHRERAELLRRRSKLLNAVIEALKIANECEAITSQMTAEKLFKYLHGAA